MVVFLPAGFAGASGYKVRKPEDCFFSQSCFFSTKNNLIRNGFQHGFID